MHKDRSAQVISNKVVQQLDASITGLDDEIKQNLSAARKAVLAKAATVSDKSFFNFNWKQSTAFASALIVIVVASISFYSSDSETLFDYNSIAFFNAEYDVNDNAVIAEYDLLDELEFMIWLVEEDHENNAG